MIRRVLAALLVAFALSQPPAAAQDAVNLEDLKIRSERGDKAATRELAEAYYLGRGGVDQDFQAAAHWYRRLASQGDARAQTSLGLMYARGLGFEKNLAEARRWWSLAAAQNDVGAQHNLGMVFLEGEGVARDPAQALHWFGRAAQRGHTTSQRIFGLMLYDGEGTAPDRVNGLTWIAISAQNGDDVAQQTLQLLAGRLPSEQLDQARARAQQWLKKQAP